MTKAELNRPVHMLAGHEGERAEHPRPPQGIRACCRPRCWAASVAPVCVHQFNLSAAHHPVSRMETEAMHRTPRRLTINYWGRLLGFVNLSDGNLHTTTRVASNDCGGKGVLMQGHPLFVFVSTLSWGSWEASRLYCPIRQSSVEAMLNFISSFAWWNALAYY
ncbi:hypothetical protein BD310DRAFT_694231 [Dichomitus squalens]|uniref:Uncharacterized protein n=1 Tax=Dichomitus squalens TaxID=114155 RepID=A0A4V2K797_9APHY|nr:hypothetical protein BD310DRAFT_694231 [Dichomitus squalens]